MAFYETDRELSTPPKSKNTIPFSFVLERLARLQPYTRPMFGCTSVYVGERIVFILRDKKSVPQDNGIWIATEREHHDSLHQEFPDLQDIAIFGPKGSTWRLLPVALDDFETIADRLCELVLAGDPRLGKLPIRKRIAVSPKKSAKAKPKKAAKKAKPKAKAAKKSKKAGKPKKRR